MTDAQVAERAAALVGLRGPVWVRIGGALGKVEGAPPNAVYHGVDVLGWHQVTLRAGVRGIGRITAIAHEVVHAAQAERLPNFRARYERAYRADGYGANAFESHARRWAARIAAIIAAESEGITDE